MMNCLYIWLIDVYKRQALQKYREGQKEESDKLYKDAEENLYTAKRAHSRVLQRSANGDFDSISLLMVHAEDQMMASETIFQLTRELFYCMNSTKG